MTNLLLVNGGSREEDNLGEPAVRERTITDPADNLVSSFTDGQTFLIRIENETGNIFSRHNWKLLLEKCLEIGEYDQ